MNSCCKVVELGSIGYAEACALQQRLVAARKKSAAPDVLLLCEHPHVITLGRNGKRENLLASDAQLRRMGVEFYDSSRGGDITYHGPGQVVGYPILHLDGIRRDVVWYVRRLEAALIEATAAFGLEAFRVAERTGVWVRPGARENRNACLRAERVEPEAKLAAIGIHISRWVTSHGFAYNVSTDLRYFDLIVPCGIAESRAASLETLLQRQITPAEATPRIVAAFGNAFGMQIAAAPREEMAEWLAPEETVALRGQS